VADLDGDGRKEIIASAYSIVVLDGASGQLRWRVPSGHDWSHPNADNVGRTWPGVVIADVDNDGQWEIVTAHGGGWVSVYNADGYLEQGWPWQNPSGREMRSLSVGDLDGNGDLEIVVGRADGSKTNVWVLEHTGAVRSGWPRLSGGEEGSAWGVYNANIALGDLDGDGLPEIVAPSDTITICAYKADGSHLPTHSMYHGHSGHDMDRWGEVPAYVDLVYETRGWGPCYEEFTPRANFAHGPANVVDVDGDGVMEVVAVGNVHDCHTAPYTDLYNTPFVFRADRSRFQAGGLDWTTVPTDTGEPLSEDWSLIENAQPNPVSVDLDGDGQLEILFASYDGKMHCFWLDQTEKGNWPYSVHHPQEGFYRFASEPAVADLDGDGKAEVIFASWVQKGTHSTGKLHVLDSLGNPVHEIDLPPAFGGADWNGALAAPTLDDIDGDGELEVILNTAHSGMVAYDLPGTSEARVLWRTGRGSYLRAGRAEESGPLLLGPDLIVAWQDLRLSGPDGQGLYSVKGVLQVTNRGNRRSRNCAVHVFYPDEADMILKGPLKVKGIKPGRRLRRSFAARGVALVPGAPSQFIAVVDPDNAVAESREDNNRATYLLSPP
jgi:hypothetical protein